MSKSKISAITKAFQSIDLTEGELHTLNVKLQDCYSKLATSVLRRKAKDITKLTIEKELDRLIDVAKQCLADDGYEPENVDPKNVWSGIKNTMRLRLAKSVAPDMKVTVTAGKDEKGNTVTAPVKVSELPETSASISKTNATLRKALNPDETDGRKSNKRKATRGANTTPKKTDTGAPQQHSNDVDVKTWAGGFALAFKQVATTKLLMRAIIDNFKTIAKHGESMGYKLTCEKISK